MIKRNYYSIRTGKMQPDQIMNFDIFKKFILVAYNKLNTDGYFQKHFGIYCDDGYQEGLIGSDIDAVIFLNLRKENIYPIWKNLPNYSEDDLFDVIEFLYDHCSKGLTGYYHSYNNCGYHYSEFDDLEGQKHFRAILNPILAEYKEGFEISENGEILTLADEGLSTLIDADLPTTDNENIKDRFDAAILKFRRHKSSLDDRKEAIRELADVLEFLRPSIKKHLNKKDENDIFNIANNFGIRHHNKDQQNEYDKAIWYSWIFYYYLATIHAVLRMKSKN
jgi:hypothetical protein